MRVDSRISTRLSFTLLALALAAAAPGAVVWAQPAEEEPARPLVWANARLNFDDAGEAARVLGGVLMQQAQQPLEDLLTPFGISSADLSALQLALDQNHTPTLGARFRSDLGPDAAARALEQIQTIGMPARLDGETVWLRLGAPPETWPSPLPLDLDQGELARVDLNWPLLIETAGAQVDEAQRQQFEDTFGMTLEEARGKPEMALLVAGFDLAGAAIEQISRVTLRAGVDDRDTWVKLEFEALPGSEIARFYDLQRTLASDFSFMPGECIVCMAGYANQELHAALQEVTASSVLSLEWTEEEEQFLREAVHHFGHETGTYSAAGAYLADGGTQLEFALESRDPARTLALMVDYYRLVIPAMMASELSETETAEMLSQIYAQAAERSTERVGADGRMGYSILLSDADEPRKVTAEVVPTERDVRVRLEARDPSERAPSAAVLSRSRSSDASLLRLDRRPWFLLAVIPHRVGQALETREQPGSDLVLLDNPEHIEQVRQITEAVQWRPEDRLLFSIWQEESHMSIELRAPSHLLTMLSRGGSAEESSEGKP